MESEPAKRARFSDVFVGHWRGLLVVLIVAIGYNALSYIFKTFSVAYLTEYQGFSANVTSGAIMVAGLVAIPAVWAFGELCDRFGAKWIISAGGALAACFGFVFLWLLGLGQTWAAYVAIGIGTGILAPMMFSAQGSFLSRQFTPDVRSTGVGTSREIGTAIAGGLAPLGALGLVAASPTDSTFWVGVILAFSGVLVLAAAAFDQGRRFTTERN